MANGGPPRKKLSRNDMKGCRTQTLISLAAIRNRKLIEKLKDY